jgi:hypothetical protein
MTLLWWDFPPLSTRRFALQKKVFALARHISIANKVGNRRN